MSQVIKHIEADPDTSYLFQVSLDHAPEPGELADIENQIQDAMAALGVPAEQVSVLSLKSAVKDGMATPQEEEVPQPGQRYLLFVLIQTEEGGFTEDRGEVGERAARAFAKFAGVSPEDVSAVVLEDAYLEVKIRPSPPKASVASYTTPNMTPEWAKQRRRPR